MNIYQTKPKIVLLYYITDRSQFAGADSERRTLLLDRIALAAAVGVDFIQLREKDLPARSLASLAEEALARIRSHNSSTRLLINSRTDVALSVDADGVHLTANDISVADARAIVGMNAISRERPRGREFLVAISCHSLSEVRSARALHADFIVLAPIFEKLQARRPGIGLDALGAGCREAGDCPVFALGGVNVTNAASCLGAGASGLAGIRLFQEGDLQETVRRLHAF